MKFLVGLGILVGIGCWAVPSVAHGPKVLTTGYASYYHPKAHGRCCTANGERINLNDFTAAHRTLPFGTRVRVIHTTSKRQVVVRINDRGPYGRRLIDLSTAAFQKLAHLRHGVIPVRLEVL